MTIILLNFLIALISQKYEEAMKTIEITKCEHKADLNEEFFVNEDGFNHENIKSGRIFILQMETQDD